MAAVFLSLCLGPSLLLFGLKQNGTFHEMAVQVEIHHTGSQPGERAEIAAMIEHALADRSGDWKVSIIGSQANDRWEMRIAGPNGFERSYGLEGTAGEHAPRVIASVVAKMVPAVDGS
jgi:hypothetical protein